jgi:hypothetical protein
MIYFSGAKISSDTGFLLLREMDERFDIIGPMSVCLKDPRAPVHTRHSLVQMIGQRLYRLGGQRGFQRRQPSPNRSFASGPEPRQPGERCLLRGELFSSPGPLRLGNFRLWLKRAANCVNFGREGSIATRNGENRVCTVILDGWGTHEAIFCRLCGLLGGVAPPRKQNKIGFC